VRPWNSCCRWRSSVYLPCWSLSLAAGSLLAFGQSSRSRPWGSRGGTQGARSPEHSLNRQRPAAGSAISFRTSGIVIRTTGPTSGIAIRTTGPNGRSFPSRYPRPLSPNDMARSMPSANRVERLMPGRGTVDCKRYWAVAFGLAQPRERSRSICPRRGETQWPACWWLDSPGF